MSGLGTLTPVIPATDPQLGPRETEYVLDCVRSGRISSSGPYVARFEKAWARCCGVRHGVAVSSGTAALFAAVAALGLEPGDEVVIPTFTFVGCAHAVLAAGATPVLVDCDERTWCMDVSQVAELVTRRTRAVMAVHIYGHPVDMSPLRPLARRHSLALVEDAAEAHGAEYCGTWAGALGDVACFSFYADEILTTGEGGMVVTDDAELAARVRSYVDMAFRPDRRFLHAEIGFNHRLTSLQAAVGLAQVEDFDGRVARKREIAARYAELLSDVAGLELPAEMPWARNAYSTYGIVISEETGLDAQALAGHMETQGIETRPFFVGMHEQPVFLSRGLFTGERHPVAERIARQGLQLPSGLGLTDEDVEDVARAVQRGLRRK